MGFSTTKSTALCELILCNWTFNTFSNNGEQIPKKHGQRPMSLIEGEKHLRTWESFRKNMKIFKKFGSFSLYRAQQTRHTPFKKEQFVIS